MSNFKHCLYIDILYIKNKPISNMNWILCITISNYLLNQVMISRVHKNKLYSKTL
ncbi:hypothetical protein C2G38_2098998 [Gigaspora rosea]|uniref:Uncharacterized protein n=1 Tax=Gigaspora rosea TaxID=44941 RepID=A0A397UWR2_9GLOM|nr:hypothetical protein C2G38_2098998 [Gigaspora rosea]